MALFTLNMSVSMYIIDSLFCYCDGVFIYVNFYIYCLRMEMWLQCNSHNSIFNNYTHNNNNKSEFTV